MDNINEKSNIPAAEEKVVSAAGAYTHVFAKPFEYEGKKYEQITFDWGKLTGADSLAIENEIQALGKAMLTPEFSGEYLIRMAARSSVPRVGVDVITAMPINDFNKIRSRARAFLLNLVP